MNNFLNTRKGQNGSALVLVIILLLLASLVIFFSVNLGVQTQRSTGNDMRSRLVQQTADSALSQAAETVLANNALLTTAANWELCLAADTTFPCGAVPAARRASMYRFIAGTQNQNIFADTTIDKRLLNNNNKILKVNTLTDDASAVGSEGFDINYGVGVVMCRLTPAAPGVAPTCSTDTSVQTRIYAITLVAVASMPNEGARATAVRSFATSAPFGYGADAPTITTNGLVNLSGTLQVVTAANADGGGGAVSVWTRNSIDGQGTPNTCYAGEFYRNFKNNALPTQYLGILRCDTCSCPSEGSLTKNTGGDCEGGSDLLVGGKAECGLNAQIAIGDPAEFPCDMFEYVFGIAAWRDVNPKDNFCEQKIKVSDSYGQLGADEAFLLQRASVIISDDDFGGRLTGDVRKVDNCNAGVLGKSGIIWDRAGKCLGGGIAQLGTPTAPVLLVEDKAGIFSANLFGLLFVRDTSDGTTDRVASDGGSGQVKVNSNVAIYGGIVVDGKITANGGAAVIHDSQVLQNLINNLNRPDVVALPGSWSDNVRF